MEDESQFWTVENHDPNFVKRDLSDSSRWVVNLGGAYPFKYPDGRIVYPDGKVITPDGFMFNIVFNKEKRMIGVQYYSKDHGIPLSPGESITLSTGETYVQQEIVLDTQFSWIDLDFFLDK